MKQLFLLVFLFCYFAALSQTEEEVRTALNSISSVNQIDVLKESHPDWTISLKKTLPVGITYDSLIYNSAVGDTFTVQSGNSYKRVYKTLEKSTEEVCKVHYIYLDGKRRSIQEINALREQIIQAYKDGTPFIDLVRKFSEDGNSRGILDWFYLGMMDPTFDKAVRPKSAGQIFTVDVPQRYWYYVVLKKDENKELPCTYSVVVQIEK